MTAAVKPMSADGYIVWPLANGCPLPDLIGGAGDVRGTRLVRDGELRLDPPGLTLPIAALFNY